MTFLREAVAAHLPVGDINLDDLFGLIAFSKVNGGLFNWYPSYPIVVVFDIKLAMCKQLWVCAIISVALTNFA